ncbi:MAG: DUF6880 family protein [Janthinobacterium lividum]
MATGKALNAANLESLGAPRLAALLLEAVAGNAAAQRRLRLELAGTAGSVDVARQVAKRLAAIATARSFVDWRKTKPLAAELDVQRRAIRDLVAPADPREAFELAWRLAACARPVLARSSDGTGRLAALFRDAVLDLGPLARSARPDPSALAQRALQAIRADGLAAWEDLVPALAPALGPPGLATLRILAESWLAEPAPTPPEHERRAVGWNPVTGAILAADVAASQRRRAARAILQQVADATGDVDAFIALHDPESRKTPPTAAAIARRLLAASRPDEALAVIEAARLPPGQRPPPDLAQVRLDALDALGRPDEAQALRWQHFAATLDPAPLREHLRRLPDFEDFDAEQRAMAHALAHRDTPHALAFLLAWPDLASAARLVLARAAKLDGHRHDLLDPAADALDARHPLAATLLRRAVIGATLAASRTARYPHAARHLDACAALAACIPDFGDTPDHDAYVRALRTAHARRTAFWDLVTPAR